MVDNCIGYRKPSQTSKKLTPIRVRNAKVWSSILHGDTIFFFLRFFWSTAAFDGEDGVVAFGVGVDDESFEGPFFAGLDDGGVGGGGRFEGGPRGVLKLKGDADFVVAVL